MLKILDSKAAIDVCPTADFSKFDLLSMRFTFMINKKSFIVE